MADIAELGFKVDTGDLAKAEKHLNSLDDAGKRTQTTAGLVTGAVAGMAAAAAAVGFGFLAGDAMSYADALAEVSTLVDTTAFDMEALSDAALDMSGEFGKVPTDTVKAFYQAISAGAVTAEQAVDAMTTANLLAVGGVTNIETAVGGLSAAMNAYNGEAGSFTDIADAMFVAMRGGMTTIDELSRSIGNVAPIASTAGASLDEVLAATAALTAGGVATSTAMDGIRATIASVIKPTAEAAKLAEQLGIQFNAAGLQTMGLAGFLEHLADKTGGSVEKMGVLFGGIEALNPVLALTGAQSGKFAEVLDQMGVKAGEAQLAFDKMAASPGFQMDRILQTLSAGFTKLGQGIMNDAVPALKSIADGLDGAFVYLDELMDTVGTAWDTFKTNLQFSDDRVFVALRDIGGALESIGGYLVPLIPYLDDFAVAVAAIGATSVAITALGVAFGLMTSPVTLTVAAVASLAVAVNEVYQNWDGVVAWWEGMMSDMATAVDDFAGAGSWDALSSVAEAAWDGIQASFEIGFGMVTGIVEAGLQILRGDFEAGWDTLVETANAFGEDLQLAFFSMADMMLQAGIDLITWLGQGIKNSIAYAVEAAKDVASSVVTSVKASVGNMFDVGKDVVGGLVGGLLWWKDDVADASSEVVGVIEPTMREQTQTQSPSRVTFRVGTDVAQGLADGLAAGMDSVGYAARQLAQHTESFFTDLYDNVVRSIADADSIRDALGGIGDFMEDWLRKYIAHFATNAITVFLGMDGSGLQSGFAGLMSFVKGGFSDAANGIIGTVSSISPALGGLALSGAKALGATTNFVGSMDAAAASVSGAAESITGFQFNAASGAIAAGALGYALGELGGAANSAAMGVLSTIGSLVGGPLGAGLGAALGSAFGGSWQHIESGLELAFKDGDLTGRSYEYFEKERSMWRGTATKIVYEELNGEIAQGLRDFMTGLGDTITTLAEGLGIEGADKIMRSFEVASANLDARSGDMEAQIEAYFNRVSLGAYRAIYDNMGPQMQSAVEGMVNVAMGSTEQAIASGGSMIERALSQMNADIANGVNAEEVAAAVERWEAALAEVAIVINDLSPLMEGLGISMGQSQDEIHANTLAMAESFGGAGNAFAMVTDFANKFAPEGELAAIQLDQARQRLDEWNISVGRGSINVSESTNFIDAWRNSLDLSTASGFNMSRILDSFVVGFDEATGAMQLNMVGLMSYRDTLDTNTEYGAMAAANVDLLTEAFQRGGSSAIMTSDQLYDLAMAQDLTTEAGRGMFTQLMALGDSILLLEAEADRVALTLDTVSSAAERLNLNFDPTSSLAEDAADALVELAGGLDEFTRKTNAYYEEYYSAEERKQIELAASAQAVNDWTSQLSPLQLQLAGVTDGVVDTREEFRLVVESFDLTTEAGRRMWNESMNVSGSFGIVADSGQTVAQILGSIPDVIEPAVVQATGQMSTVSDVVISSLQEVANEARIAGPQMQGVLLDAFDTILADAGITANQLPVPLQNAYRTMQQNVDGVSADMTASTSSLANSANASAQTISNAAGSAQGDLTNLSGGIDSMGNASVGAANDASRSASQVSYEMHLTARYFIDAADRMQNTMYGASRYIRSMTDTIGSDMSSMGSRIGSASGGVRNLTSHISRLADAANSAARRFSSAASVVDGSHATGLGHVPFDGYIAELHKGEAVMPADVTSWLKNNGFPTPTVAVNAPAVSSVQNRDDGSREALEAIRRELADLRRENAEMAQQASNERRGIASVGQQQNDTLRDMERSNDRYSRKLVGALS